MALSDEERKKQQNLRKEKQRENDRAKGLFEKQYKATLEEHEKLQKYLAELRGDK